LVTDAADAAGRPLVGVLALQGGFAAHARALERSGARVVQVRTPAGLDALDALVLPGGESTTMMLGMAREGLEQPLRDFAASQRPMLATCAGLIVLDRERLGILDLRCERNAFGRQLHSFEDDLDVDGVDGGPMHAVFIRAPWVAEHGPDVRVLARVDGHPVAVAQGAITAVSFHPELAGDDRLHAGLVQQVTGRLRGRD
jgi:pyridoxal 5'-phosphate synthase pdxT subunit